MTPSWTTIFVPLFAVWVCVWGQDCDPQRLVQCQSVFSEKMKTESFLVAETRDDLNNFCRQVSGVLTCIDSFMNECMRNVENPLMIKLLSGVRAFKDEMCRADSPLAEEYLRHAPCLARAAPKVKPCHEKFKSLQKNPNLSGGQSQQDEVKTACCNIKSMMGCLLDGFKNECGAESIPPVRRSMEIVILPVEEAVCGTVDKSQCPSVGYSGSVGVVGSRAVALVSLTTTLWLWWCRR